jgi:hypothetical protein
LTVWGGSLRPQCIVHELAKRLLQNLERSGHRVPPSTEQVRPGDELVGVRPDDRSKAASDTVSRDCSAHTADGVGNPRERWRRRGRVEHTSEGERTPANGANPGQGLEGRTVPDSGNQAERRLRPRWRRFFSTARPPRVRMRNRNPWVFFRLRLLG